MIMKSLPLLLFITYLTIGCAPTKYHWGNYEHSLYSYYKNPAEVEKFAESLFEIIERGEINGKVPPGIYAEYGYILMITKDSKNAIIYFDKEKATWPESAMLMDKMIALTSNEDKINNKEVKKAKKVGGVGTQ